MKDIVRVVIATMIVGCLTIGPHFVVSEYYSPLKKQQGWRDDFIQLTVAVGSLGYIMSGLIGGDIKKRGYTFYAATGCILMALSHGIAALGVRYGQLWLFIIGQGFFDTFGAGCLLTVMMSHIAEWIDPAIGSSLVGGCVGFSATGMSYAMGAAIDQLSAEICLWGLTVLCFLAAFSAPMFRKPNLQSNAAMALKTNIVVWSRSELLHMPPMYVTWLMVTFGLTPGFALISAYDIIFQDVLKISYFTAAIYTGVANGCYCIGRVLGGVLCRVWGVRQWGLIQCLLGALASAGAALAGYTNQNYVFVVCVSLVGMQLGACQVYAGPLIVWMFGKPNLAAVYGIILTAVAVASVLGPWGTLSATQSATGSYIPFFLISTGQLLVAALCVATMKPTDFEASESLSALVVPLDEPKE